MFHSRNVRGMVRSKKSLRAILDIQPNIMDIFALYPFYFIFYKYDDI